MSSACSVNETSVVGAGGLDTISQNEDVLFLTPNQDQEEEEYEVDVKVGNESLEEANARSMYANNAQISLLADVDDLNEESEKNSESHTTNAESKPTESSYLSGDQVTADLSGSFDDPNATKNDESHNSDQQVLANGHLENLNVNNVSEIMSGNKTGINESILSDMKYLFKNTRYFLIKSNNFDNVNLAKQKSVWSTPRVNEIKLNKAYRECANVLLIFSVAESGRFQGIARLSSDCRKDEDLQVNWILPPTLSARSLNGVFKIDWITKNDLFFTKCAYILNPWNENKPVKVGRDGQEIEPHSGELLCRQFDLNDGTSQSEEHITSLNENLLTITNRSKQRHEELVNEKERQKSRQCDRDRHRRSRDRSPRSSDEKSSSLEGNNSLHRTSDSSSITAPYADHRDSANYHRNYKDYQGNHHHQQQSFSQKRNYYDVNKKPNYNDRHSHHNRGPHNYPNNHYTQNYQYNKNNYQNYQQQMQPLHQNGMNMHHTHQQPFYQLQHDNLMHPMQNMPHYQHNMQQMDMQNYQMYQQRAPQNNQNDTHKKHRNRSSSPKKQRRSDDFLPSAKEIVLKSTTYEEYLAAAARMTSSQNYPNQIVDPRIRGPGDTNPYGNYDSSYQTRGNYQGPYQFNQAPNPAGNPTVDSSKYEKEVEEFLRRTTGVAPVTNQHKFKEDDRLSQTRNSEKKKSSSKEKDRDHHKHHKHEKKRSSSRERTRRRSKDRK